MSTVARVEFVLKDAQDCYTVSTVHQEALRVLRPSISRAVLDAYSDCSWPEDVIPFYERVIGLARTELRAGIRKPNSDLGMGIDINVRDDEQFEALSRLLPHTIHAEAWPAEGKEPLLSADDTGTALWFALTPPEEASFWGRLQERGVRPDALAYAPARRWWHIGRP